jgi:outer membrane cobalamin receptor
VDPEEIERRKPSRVTDLLRGASGVEVISQGAFDADIRLFASRRLQGDCPPTIYIDGVAARLSPKSGPPLTQLVDVASVAALEVLRRPAEIPARYRGAQSACGVILIWLKR